MADEALIGMPTPGAEVIPPELGRVLHEGAEAFLDAATDKRTTTALDRLAGTELRLGVLVAAMAASALSFVLRGRFVRRPDRIEDDRVAEETA